jgi:hypothetical protein
MTTPLTPSFVGEFLAFQVGVQSWHCMELCCAETAAVLQLLQLRTEAWNRSQEKQLKTISAPFP